MPRSKKLTNLHWLSAALMLVFYAGILTLVIFLFSEHHNWIAFGTAKFVLWTIWYFLLIATVLRVATISEFAKGTIYTLVALSIINVTYGILYYTDFIFFWAIILAGIVAATVAYEYNF